MKKNEFYIYEHQIRLYNKFGEFEDITIRDRVQTYDYLVYPIVPYVLDGFHNLIERLDADIIIKDCHSDYFVKSKHIIKAVRIRKYIVEKYKYKKRRKWKKVRKWWGYKNLEFQNYYYTIEKMEMEK